MITTVVLAAMLPMGLLLPESTLAAEWFGIFAAFVAINTVIYVLLSVSKLFPVIRFGRRGDGQSRRVETRSIYPEGFAQYQRGDDGADDASDPLISG